MSINPESIDSKNATSERPSSSPQSVPFVSQIATGNSVSLENALNKEENLVKFQYTINSSSNSNTL